MKHTRMKHKQAFLISLEGIEGSGKTTQCRKLAAYLRRQGMRVAVLREPGSSKFGEEMRRILLHGRGTISPLTETLLFMAARAELVRQKVAPGLLRYDVVIIDRYVDATAAYQGYGSDVDLRLIDELNKQASAGLMPDMTLLFDLDPRVGLKRCGQDDRFERRALEFHLRVRCGYLALSRRQPQRFRVIPVEGAVAEVFVRVQKAVEYGLRTRIRSRRSRVGCRR